MGRKTADPKRKARPAVKQQVERGRHLGLAILIAITVAIVSILALFPQFRLDEIETDGLRVLTREEVLDVADMQVGTHLLKGLGPDLVRALSLRYGNIEDRVSDLSPYIRTVKARLVFPSVIRIEVEERIEVAYLSVPDGHVIIDAREIALEINRDTPPDGIPLIEGVTVEGIVLGQKLQLEAEGSIRSAMLIMDAIIKSDHDDESFSLFAAVEGLRAVNGQITYMTILLPETRESLVIRLGTQDSMNETIEWLRGAILKGHMDGLGKGVLDLSGTHKVFRPDQ